MRVRCGRWPGLTPCTATSWHPAPTTGRWSSGRRRTAPGKRCMNTQATTPLVTSRFWFSYQTLWHRITLWTITHSVLLQWIRFAGDRMISGWFWPVAAQMVQFQCWPVLEMDTGILRRSTMHIQWVLPLYEIIKYTYTGLQKSLFDYCSKLIYLTLNLM